MLEIPIWPGNFNARLLRWMLYERGVHGGREPIPPGCPDCNNRPVEFVSEIGRPLRILFACGHQFQAPIAGIKQREIR